MSKTIDIVFDGPPGPTAGHFVEVEDSEGKSINFGEWIDRGDGFWVLRMPDPRAETLKCCHPNCDRDATWRARSADERRPDVGETETCDVHLVEIGLTLYPGNPFVPDGYHVPEFIVWPITAPPRSRSQE